MKSIIEAFIIIHKGIYIFVQEWHIHLRIDHDYVLIAVQFSYLSQFKIKGHFKEKVSLFSFRDVSLTGCNFVSQ